MHNFPKNIIIECKEKHNLEQGKEILKLCIENNVIISESTQEEVKDDQFPYFMYGREGILTQTYSINENNDELTVTLRVTLREFKQFVIGKGKYKTPFNEELKLNSGYTATVTKEKIIVGCQLFSHDTVKKLYLLSQKALKS